MSIASEAMERVQFHLALAGAHAHRLGRMLELGLDEDGRPAVLVLPFARHLLAQALRDAADEAEILGVEHGDHRWVGIVALIHHASSLVWSVWDGRTFRMLGDHTERLRLRVMQLRQRAMSREVSVRLS